MLAYSRSHNGLHPLIVTLDMVENCSTLPPLCKNDSQIDIRPTHPPLKLKKKIASSHLSIPFGFIPYQNDWHPINPPTPETEKKFAASHFSIPFGRFYNLWKWICLILQFFGESSRAFPRTDQHREKNLDRSNFVTAGKPKGYKPCHLVKNDICMKCVQVPRRSTSCGTARKTVRAKKKRRGERKLPLNTLFFSFFVNAWKRLGVLLCEILRKVPACAHHTAKHLFWRCKDSAKTTISLNRF